MEAIIRQKQQQQKSAIDIAPNASNQFNTISHTAPQEEINADAILEYSEKILNKYIEEQRMNQPVDSNKAHVTLRRTQELHEGNGEQLGDTEYGQFQNRY